MNKLKPCPKCMSKIPPWVLEHKDRDGTSNGWYVECELCGLTCGKLFDTKEVAIDNWNKRPECNRCKYSDLHTPNKKIICDFLGMTFPWDFYCAKFEEKK